MSQEKENLDILLSQWQTCVEMANSISQRRDSMNNIFITLNLAILAAVSITWDIKSIFVLTAGIVICIIWMVFIRNYKLLNKAKFDVINELESKLPAAPLKDEWEILKKDKKYRDTTRLEKWLPITFIILYTVMVIFVIALKISCRGGN